MRVIIAFFLTFILCASSFAATNNLMDNKAYFENIIKTMLMMTGSYPTLKNPEVPGDAEDIIQSSIYFADKDNKEALDKFNQPLRTMGVENGVLIPEEMVNDTVCLYYGYNVQNNSKLQDAAFKKKSINNFYFNPRTGDGAFSTPVIKSITPQSNGDIVAKGVDEDSDSNFTAWFHPVDCGKFKTWILMKME